MDTTVNGQSNGTGTESKFNADIFAEAIQSNTEQETELPTPIKRGRGRPKGSTNKPKDTATIQAETLGIPSYKKQTNKSTKMSEDNADKTALFILDITQKVVTSAFKVDGSFNEVENTLLGMSISNYLQSVEFSTVEKMSKILYPLAAIAGVSMYGLRVANSIQEKRLQEQEQRKQEQQDNPNIVQSNNGNSNEELKWMKQDGTISLNKNF
jgi:hypothetical protein